MGWETVNRLEQIGVQIHGWMSHLPSTRSRGRWMDRQGSRQEGTHPPTKFFQNHTATHQMRTLFSSCQVNYPFPSPPAIDGSMAASLSCSLVVVGTARQCSACFVVAWPWMHVLQYPGRPGVRSISNESPIRQPVNLSQHTHFAIIIHASLLNHVDPHCHAWPCGCCISIIKSSAPRPC
jgi:hypothetical protein